MRDLVGIPPPASCFAPCVEAGPPSDIAIDPSEMRWKRKGDLQFLDFRCLRLCVFERKLNLGRGEEPGSAIGR